MKTISYYGDGSTRFFATPGASGASVSVDIFSTSGGSPNETIESTTSSGVTLAVAPARGATIKIQYNESAPAEWLTDANGNLIGLRRPDGTTQSLAPSVVVGGEGGFSTVAALLADSALSAPEGAIVNAGGHRYQAAASSATDHHVTTAGGLKLYVLPELGADKPTYRAEAFGIGPATSGLGGAITQALARIPAHSIFALPPGEYDVQRTPIGSVQASISGTLGGIYLDKPGQELVGAGWGTHLNGNNGQLHLIMLRASHCRVRNLRAGNVSGNLTTGESSAVVIEPSNYPLSNPNGADIEDFIVEGCWFYQCESGVSARPMAWGNIITNDPAFPAPRFTDFYRARGVVVRNNRMTAMYRHGVELSSVINAEVTGNDISIGPLSGALSSSIQRGVRGLGSLKVRVADNTFTATEVNAAATYGVELGPGGLYGLSERSMYSQDFLIADNQFHDFVIDIESESHQLDLSITGNLSRKPHSAGPGGRWFLRVDARGVLANAGFKRIASKALVVGNTMIGAAEFVRVAGAMHLLEVRSNTMIGGDIAAHFVIIENGTHADPAISALEKVDMAIIDGNTAIMKPTNDAPIRINNKPSGTIYVDNNHMTASTANRLISGLDGVVITKSAASNRRLPEGEWAAYWNPPDSLITSGAV